MLWLVVAAAAAVITGVLTVRFGRLLLRPALWRLRNRLIVAYLFIALIPICLILVLARNTVREVGARIAVHFVSSELDRRATALLGAARGVARAPAERREITLQRMESLYQQRFPGLQILVDDRVQPEEPDASGILVKDSRLHIWACARYEDRRVTFLAPITRRWLEDLSPGLGDVSILHYPESGKSRLSIRTHDAPGEDETASVPPPVNSFDVDLLWASEVPLAMWEAPKQTERALLGVHSRLSAVLRMLLTQQDDSRLSALLYLWLAVFLVIQVISVYIGVSVTRSITGAFNSLYAGTERVMQGDFSHRIQVRGDDQISELSRSFNRMTENLENLLRVAKENERIQAELEIARQVQSELFPKQVPKLQCLSLRAVCKPARTVSGDYFDYQLLSDSKLALALGDVAGKGISAALLMASIQSSFRVEIGTEGVTPVNLVSRLNKQLHANTAPEKFATFFFGIFDDCEGTLRYTNAGHLPPLLFRGSEVIPLDVSGMVVGAFPFAKYSESFITLHPGDLLVGYTDGITEPENEFGEMFGEQRLIDTVKQVAHCELDEIVDTVLKAVQQFTGSPELQDDMTVIVARRL